MRPVQLLAEAHRLLGDTSTATVSVWSHASALLCRQALEGALRELWAARASCLQWVPMRAQLACLPSYLSDDTLAAEVTFTWYALSHATHHRPYELDPTREELESLVAATSRLIVAVDRRASAGAGVV
jgi:hypothetical protein